MIEIHTDGACSGNPGHGGWAALIRSPEGVREICGSAANTTNNRMELQAAIEGLRAVPAPSPVTVFSDSEYLIKGMTEWIEGWKRRNWKNSAKKSVENRDLWETLDALAGGRVTWNWVRGHAGHPDNERVNALAQREATRSGPRSEIENDTVAGIPATTPDEGAAVTFPCYLSLVNGVAARHTTWDACKARTSGCPGEDKKKCRSPEEAQATLRGWGLPPDLPDEWQGTAAAPTPSPSAPQRLPSRLFARGVLDRVQSYLEGIGFRQQRDNGKDVALHLVKASAHAVAYTTGRLLAQGSWTALDLQHWETLLVQEDGWLRLSVDAANQCPAPAPFCWSTEVCRYLFTHLSAGSVRGWSAEPIGRLLLVREGETGYTAGVLSPCAWRRLVPEASDAIARSVQDRRWHEQGRACVAISQDQHKNLTAVSVRFSRAACALAGLWNWEAAGEAEPEEQRRIVERLYPFLECRCKKWGETGWREAAAAVGNQVDVLVEWVRQTLAPGRMPALPSCVRPVEVIGTWGGSEECAARLLEQRSAGALRFRSPLLAEEIDVFAMARFLARSPMEPSHGH
jgi:ribonuclease HI